VSKLDIGRLTFCFACLVNCTSGTGARQVHTTSTVSVRFSFSFFPVSLLTTLFVRDFGAFFDCSKCVLLCTKPNTVASFLCYGFWFWGFVTHTHTHTHKHCGQSFKHTHTHTNTHTHTVCPGYHTCHTHMHKYLHTQTHTHTHTHTHLPPPLA